MCKQVRDQRNGAQVLLENEHKSICYPYSDWLFGWCDSSQNRDNKYFRI